MTRIEYKKEERGKSFDMLRMTRIEYNNEERRKRLVLRQAQYDKDRE